MIEWQYYPRSDPLPPHLGTILSVFEAAGPIIASRANDTTHSLSSDKVLGVLAEPLAALGYLVEVSKRAEDK